MKLEEAIAAFRAVQKKKQALLHINYLMTHDGDTVAPKHSAAGRSVTLGVVAEYNHALLTAPSTRDLLDELESAREQLPAQVARELTVMEELCGRLTRVPGEEYVAYTRLVSDATAAWHDAKANNDFLAFAPYLQQMMDFQRRMAGYYDSGKKPYDVLLDQHEKGASMEMLDPFFDALRQTVSPLLKEVAAAEPIDTACLTGTFPREKQAEMARYVMAAAGLPEDDCVLGETEHPYTTGLNKHDVRITTHYYENDFTRAMFTVLHEGGHAMYELNTADELEWTCLRGGWDGAMHESQSRFYENYVGRSEAFLTFLLPRLQELFPSMAGVSAHDFYRAANRVKTGPIRTEADELTYPLHILVRYEIEKALLDGSLSVKDVPGEWNRLYREYLGLEVPDDARGCLQDVHWGNGLVGYFPTYALGSAYGAQYLWAMEKDLDVTKACGEGNVAAITDWLREHIHRFGRLLEPAELMVHATGAPFDPTHYTDYLQRKYRALYHL